MRAIAKIPGLSLMLMVGSYAFFGWLLSIYGSDWRYWIVSGAIAVATEWFLALAWGIAAVVLVFRYKSDAFMLSVGICLIWALLMYIARLEIKAAIDGKGATFIILAVLAAIGMGLGWFTDAQLIPQVGNSIIK